MKLLCRFLENIKDENLVIEVYYMGTIMMPKQGKFNYGNYE